MAVRDSLISSLVGPSTSRAKKLALLAQAKLEGLPVDLKWEGVPMRSRLRISVNGSPWCQCQSFDEDVVPTFEFNK